MKPEILLTDFSQALAQFADALKGNSLIVNIIIPAQASVA